MTSDAIPHSRWLATLLVAGSFAACGNGGGAGTAASLDAGSAATGSAILTWARPTQNVDGSPLDDLAGYSIYYGTKPTQLDHVIRLRDPQLTRYLIRPLRSGTYYFSVRAYTASGAASISSQVVSKTIP